MLCARTRTCGGRAVPRSGRREEVSRSRQAGGAERSGPGEAELVPRSGLAGGQGSLGSGASYAPLGITSRTYLDVRGGPRTGPACISTPLCPLDIKKKMSLYSRSAGGRHLTIYRFSKFYDLWLEKGPSNRPFGSF